MSDTDYLAKTGAGSSPAKPDGSRGGRLRAATWLPVLLLLLIMMILWASNLRRSYESPSLLVALNFTFSTLTSSLIAYLIGRSFMIRGTLGLLMLGCGVVIWGAAGVVAAGVGRGNANTIATIHNCCVLLSACCHLSGAALALRSDRSVRNRGLLLTTGYTLGLGAVGWVTLATVEGWTPLFFQPAQGGTPVRQLILGLAIGMFALTAALLVLIHRRSPSSFARWYSLALALIAVGLGGVMFEPAFGSPLSWAGRTAQYLGGVYMLVAAVASVRELRAWEVLLEVALQEEREQLRQSESRYRTLIETIPDAVIVYR